MSFLPIVGRELVVAARRPATHRVRFWAALVALGVWLLLFTRSTFVAPGEMGKHLLNALGVVSLAFSLFAGMFRTADCLSEEKREGTLGLLFLTDLRGYDVVLGKLVAGSLDSFFGLLAIFPVIGLTLMLGGVTGGEFGRLVLVLVTTLFFSLGIGMFASAVSQNARQAMTRGFLLVLIFAGLFPVLWGVWSYLQGGPAPDWLLMPSPVYAYIKAFEFPYHALNGPSGFWHGLETVSGLGLAGIVAAAFILPRSWQQTGSAKARRTASAQERPSWSGADAALRSRLLNYNPVYWLSVRDGGAGRAAKRVLAVLVPLWFVLWLMCFSGTRFNGEPFGLCVLTAFVLHLLLKLLIAAEAGRRLSQDRQSGALELLLVTPVTVEAILAGQMKALRHHFRWPIFLLCVLNASLWLALASQSVHMGGPDFSLFTEFILGGVVVLILDFYALSWVGMWQGLNAPRHSRAVARTILRVMGIPWLAIFFIVFTRPFRSAGGAAFTFAVWFGIGGVVDLALAAAARQKLRREFRRAAAGRFQKTGD